MGSWCTLDSELLWGTVGVHTRTHGHCVAAAKRAPAGSVWAHPDARECGRQVDADDVVGPQDGRISVRACGWVSLSPVQFGADDVRHERQSTFQGGHGCAVCLVIYFIILFLERAPDRVRPCHPGG